MIKKKYKLGEIATIIGGVSFDKSDITTQEGIRILRGGNIQNGEIVLKEDDIFLPKSYFNDKNRVLQGDTILVASTGSVDVLGKSATMFNHIENAQIGAFLRIIRPKHPKYIMLISAWLTSPYFHRYIEKQAKGTSINNIRNEYLEEFVISIPDKLDLKAFSNLYVNIEYKTALNRAINHNLPIPAHSSEEAKVRRVA